MDSESYIVVGNQEPLLFSLIPKHQSVGVAHPALTSLICTNINACQLPDDDENKRAPIDVIVALDVSGSMEGSKLDLCKRTLKQLLRVLLPSDRFGLVTYASEALVDIPCAPLAKDNKESAIKTIEALITRGCTNMSAAIGLAVDQLISMKTSNEVRSIFLLTDGMANQGISDMKGLVQLTKSLLDMGGPPVTMHTFGYGVDHNDQLLCALSETTSGGQYYFVENDESVSCAFGDCLGALTSVVAQNVSVHIQVPCDARNLGVRINKIFHNKAVSKENDEYTVHLGDFYAEESRDLLIEVALAKTTSNEKPIPHVRIFLSYLDTIGKRLIRTEPQECGFLRPVGSDISPENEHVAAQWLRVSGAEEMARAREMADKGDLVGASATIQRMRQSIAKTAVREEACVQELDKDLMGLETAFTSQHEYLSRGCKKLSSAAQKNTTQRMAVTNVSMTEGSVYVQSKRGVMAKMFTKST